MNKKIIGITLTALFYLASAQSVNRSISKGNEYYEEGEFELAEKQYRQALQTSNNDITAQFNLANALIRQKKYAEAEEILRKITATATDRNLKASSFYNIGVVHTKQKALEASIEGYKNALRNNPDDRQARENLQKALLELKQKQQQQQKEQQQRQKQQSKLNQNQADQKLKQLENKEKQIQQRLQNQKSKKGTSMPKDW